MANLQGSKTEANLKTAFAGESQARNKYTYFAAKAREEGFNTAAAVFEENAANEKEHAKIWFNLLGGIGGTEKNLKAAAEGENYEWTSMYSDFAKTAKEEGFNDIAKLFESVGSIEKEHEKQFLKLAENAVKTTAAESSVWRCRNCGNIVKAKEGPTKCPVCGHADVPWSGSKAYTQVKD
ncbi:MAG: rubrerythrin family protein [Elusimicrobiota bacterium]|jgi:rubrerythrin|nr:rubrerythrin family protein [Elusimicrobiota bacterium]